jgi:hypothetical protein
MILSDFRDTDSHCGESRQAPANEGLVPIRPLKIDRKQTDPILRNPKQMHEESDFLQAFISTHDTDNFTIHSATPKRVHS